MDNGHRAVFLKALSTATDAEDVTAAAVIDVWKEDRRVDPGDASFSSEYDRPLYIYKKEGMRLNLWWNTDDQETLHTVLHYDPLEHL